MKQYKLIKTFPGSPKLGTIEEPLGYIHMMINGKYGYGISESPEFWEGVIQKDYQILKVKTNIHKRISDVSCDPSDYIDALLKCTGTKIHSVKRLLDGEIFTVGDKLETGIIKQFYLPGNIQKEITIYVTKDDEDTYLSEAKHKKQPLFTTEDGVDIYEGDELYCVTIPNKWEIIKRIGGDGLAFKEEHVRKRCFSTKKAAEEYILMNKPCLSVNNIINHTCLLKRTVVQHLKNLAQSKINE